jgi:plastocyanin
MRSAWRKVDMTPSRRVAMLCVAVLLAVAGCSEDDGGDDTGVGTDSGGAKEATCAPVGDDLEDTAAETVSVQLDDYAFGPSTVEVDAGVVTFTGENVGAENHELAFLPGGGEVPLTAQGEPDEDALADAGAFELEAFGPGQTCTATYDLEPGTYTLFCIVASPDGETHYDKGMEGELVVS